MVFEFLIKKILTQRKIRNYIRSYDEKYVRDLEDGARFGAAGEAAGLLHRALPYVGDSAPVGAFVQPKTWLKEGIS